MLSLSPAIRIFVHALPTDMRKHYDGLSGIVTHSFGMDVLRGDYFVFLNRACNRCKILYWDRDGLVVWAKRLEGGRFQLPRRADPASLTIEVDSVTLAMMIGGVDLDTKPHMYVEVIKRPQYVVAGQPEQGVKSMPPPLSIVEGCKYDFSVPADVAVAACPADPAGRRHNPVRAVA